MQFRTSLTWEKVERRMEIELPSWDASEASLLSQPLDQKTTPKEAMRKCTVSELHLLTHIMRIRVGLALEKLQDAAAKEAIPQFEELHEQLLMVLGLYQEKEDEVVSFDEGILHTLERDLGAALEVLHSHKSLMDMAGMFIQFSHEHMWQKSASSISSMRSTYSTASQLSMRLRFLAGSGAKNGEEEEEEGRKRKSKVRLEEEEENEGGREGKKAPLSAEEVMERRSREEISCYVTLENWRECTLGIGLLVRPRTIRERYRNLLPTIDLVEDYVSVEAFNSGARARFSGQEGGGFDRDDEEGEEESMMVKSSSRSRINAWLPLYLNRHHWETARHFAPAAFSVIATQFNDTFKPVYTLEVCARLMCAATVRFTLEDQRLSEKALQMYADVHMLFLEMMAAYPDISSLADSSLTEFIQNPKKRTRKELANLGDLIQYLTVSDKVTWEAIKEPLVAELFRRSSRHIGNLPTNTMSSVDQLLDAWASANGDGGKVVMFSKLFLDLIARPNNMSTSQVREARERTWGKISDQTITNVKQSFSYILSHNGPVDLLRFLGFNRSKEAVAELILWALHYRHEGPPVHYQGVPSKPGPFFSLWKDRSSLWNLSQMNPPPELPFIPPPQPPPSIKERNLTGLRHAQLLLLHGSSSSDDQPIHEGKVEANCNCKRCIKEKERAAKTKEWIRKREQEKEKEKEKDEKEKEKNGLSKGGRTLFIQGYPKETTKEVLMKILSQFGDISRLDFVMNRDKMKSKQYSFVEFSDAKGMMSAMKELTSGTFTIKDGKLAPTKKQRGPKIIADLSRRLLDSSHLPSRLSSQSRKRSRTVMGENPLQGNHLLPCLSLRPSSPSLFSSFPLWNHDEPLEQHAAPFSEVFPWLGASKLNQVNALVKEGETTALEGFFSSLYPAPNNSFSLQTLWLKQKDEAFSLEEMFPLAKERICLFVSQGTLWLEGKKEPREPPAKRARNSKEQKGNGKDKEEQLISRLFQEDSLLFLMPDDGFRFSFRFFTPCCLVLSYQTNPTSSSQ